MGFPAERRRDPAAKQPSAASLLVTGRPSRRLLLIGVAVSPMLAACPWTPVPPSVALTLFSVGMSALKHIGGVAGRPGLVRLATLGGRLADGIGLLIDLEPVFAAMMRRGSSPPAPGEPPALLASSADTGAQATASPAAPAAPMPCLDVFMGQPTASLQLSNDTDVAFLVHNVYWVVRRLDEPVPTQPWELTDASAEPGFIVSLPARHSEAYEQQQLLDLAPNNTYVVYSWCIPSDRDLTSQTVADYVTVGTPFYVAYEGDAEIERAVRDIDGIRTRPTANIYYWAVRARP
jgi:hypothetical protein